MNVKQVIVIRKDLKMRRGKEIAQGAHASMAWLINRISSTNVTPSQAMHFRYAKYALLTTEQLKWIEGDFTKVVLQAETLSEFEIVANLARQAGLTTHIITDKGLTEFSGEPTMTALAIGPHYEDKIDAITGPTGKIPLKLY